MFELAKKDFLKNIVCSIKGKSVLDKEKILDKDLNVEKYFKKHEEFFSVKQKYLLKSLIVIGEKEIALEAIENNQTDRLLKDLEQVEEFFLDIGGIIGYQLKILELLNNSSKKTENLSFHAPFFIDISKDTKQVRSYVRQGIEKLDQMGEIYVVGGAADRLHLLDETTKKRLPAAMMQFASKTLLQRLIEDMQAREILYERIKGSKIITPIALMCSNENDNFHHIMNFIRDNNYFNRPKDSFFFLIQPSVPVVKESGNWIVNEDGSLLLKPSGHGALWKLAKDKKLFEWFFSKHRKKVLIRQINNPIAGTDYGILAFTGYGLMNDSSLGLASCPRQVHSAEGINVLIQKRKEDHFESTITNIEYCEFEKFNIEDKPMKSNDQFSKFSSNTNLLFVDLKEAQKKVDDNPYPGILINFKSLKTQDHKTIIGGRLESTMQNIADSFVEKTKKPIEIPYKLSKTYVTYNDRNKTISTTKRVYDPNKSYLETPEKCFYDFTKNGYDLLRNYCSMEVPLAGTFEDFVLKRPPFFFSYHPAFGPSYKLISKKLKKGALKDGSELVVNIADFFCENLQLDGSLRIFSKDLSASCFFENITINNAGIDFLTSKNLWKGNYSYVEKCDISLGTNSILIAKNLAILRNQKINIPDGMAAELINDNGEIRLKETRSCKEKKSIFFEP